MVALQILVLTVGVRILLGEKTAPSNIGLVHRPLKAERRVRLPWELKQKTRFGEFFCFNGFSVR